MGDPWHPGAPHGSCAEAGRRAPAGGDRRGPAAPAVPLAPRGPCVSRRGLDRALSCLGAAPLCGRQRRPPRDRCDTRRLGECTARRRAPRSRAAHDPSAVADGGDRSPGLGRYDGALRIADVQDGRVDVPADRPLREHPGRRDSLGRGDWRRRIRTVLRSDDPSVSEVDCECAWETGCSLPRSCWP